MTTKLLAVMQNVLSRRKLFSQKEYCRVFYQFEQNWKNLRILSSSFHQTNIRVCVFFFPLLSFIQYTYVLSKRKERNIQKITENRKIQLRRRTEFIPIIKR